MKIILVGGGTAGHINPALAVGTYIKEKEPDTKILYVGAKGGMEEKLVPATGFNFKAISISGFSRKINLKSLKHNIKTIKNIFTSAKESRKILDDFKPDICFGTGGYVCGPFLREAGKKDIPYLIHDSNSLPGVTTKLLAKKAKKILLVSETTKKYFNSDLDMVVVGNPVRCEIAKQTQTEAKAVLNFDEKPVILSFGGSLGAWAINEAAAKLISHNIKNNLYNHIHGFGKNGHWFKDLLKNQNINIENNTNLYIKEYINNMPTCMTAADLVICRAGAMSISELQNMGKPAILIPSPNVAENHQYHNAMALVNANAASIIEEKNLTGEALIKEVSKLLNNKNILETYSKNLNKMAITNADKRIYDIIKEILDKKDR